MHNYKLMLIILLLQLPALAKAEEAKVGEQCIRAKVDYERDCGETRNLNNFIKLEKRNDCVLVEVMARSHWNASGLYLKKNQTYKIEVMRGPGQPVWCDASIVTNDKGWSVDAKGEKPGSSNCRVECSECIKKDAVSGGTVNFGGITNSFIKLFSILKRKPKSNWFALIGMQDGKGEHDFEIESGKIYPAAIDGEFCAYANDASFMYGNNSGSLNLKITYMGDNGQ